MESEGRDGQGDWEGAGFRCFGVVFSHCGGSAVFSVDLAVMLSLDAGRLRGESMGSVILLWIGVEWNVLPAFCSSLGHCAYIGLQAGGCACCGIAA